MCHAFVLLLVMPTIPALGASPVVSSDALFSGNLVKTKVTKVTTLDGRPYPAATPEWVIKDGIIVYPPPYRATFVVTHVYIGPQTLVGKEFQIEQYPGKSYYTVGDPLFGAPLRTGENVLWPLDPGPTPVPGTAFVGRREPGFLLWYAIFPPRDGNPWYDDAISWAKAVEKAFKADPAARYGLLKKFATGDTPEVRTVEWALSVLIQADPRGSLSFLRDVIGRPDVKIWQKVIADQLLATMPEAAWKKSPDRLRLYQSWARGPLSSADVEAMQAVLPTLERKSDFTADDCWDLMKTVAGRKDLPGATRAAAIGDALGSYGRGLTRPASAFDFILGLVNAAEPVEVQRAAAGVLRHFPDEVRSHQNDVQAARRRIDDKTALQNFDAALRISSAPTAP